MRRLSILWLVVSLTACGGDNGGGGPASDTAADPGGAAEGLFGDWGDTAGVDHGGIADGGVDDGGVDGSVGPADGLAPDGDGEGGQPEVVVPVTWDVLVLTAVKGHLYRNGTFLTVVQNTSGAPFVALDGLQTRFYSLTADGQARVDGEPAFEVAGVPANVTFLDLAATRTAAGGYVFTLQSNGQVRNNGGAMATVTPPAGEAFAALSAEGDTYYLATASGTLFEKGQLYQPLKLPVPAGDALVALRVLNGQFYALTQAGKVLKNSVVVQDLAGKAAPPFVGLDVDGEHVYVVSRDCRVFEDATEIAALTPFTGDYCAALALIHSLD